MLNRTRTILLTAIIALLVAAPVAAAKRTYHYRTVTVTVAPVSTANGYPAVGGSAVLAGPLTTRPFGPGAVIDHVTITGQPEPTVFAFKGTEVDFFSDGTVRNRLTGTATVQEDGSQALVIKGRFTGGTGRYKGATGTYTATLTIPAGSSVATGSSRGTITF